MVFRADQEIGRDLAAVDWMSTPLGPVDGWPQSLRTAVNILLSSRFSMWMAWGSGALNGRGSATVPVLWVSACVSRCKINRF